MTQKELQDTGVFLLERNKRLICQWATGTGKSNVAIYFVKRHPDVRTLILVPEVDNIKNWRNEFSKFGVPMENVTVACYASFKNFKDTTWGLLVLDEAPHVDTELRLGICDTVKAEYVLALGAMIDEQEEQSLRNAYGDFYKTEVTLEDAVKWGILPKPVIVVCHMQLDDQKKTYMLNGKKSSAKEMYENYVRQVDKCTSDYNDNQNPVTRERMLMAGARRKRFLGKMKDQAISDICRVLNKKNRRFLCFCASIRQANVIGGKNAFTSQTPASKKLLDKFNNHEINSLYVVGKLIEGQNLVDIDCGVIGQLGGTDRITVQSIGRIMRSESPVVYVPIFDGTKDESFLYTITANIPSDYIKHYKFNQTM